MLGYEQDTLNPEYNVGFSVGVGGGTSPSATVTGGVTNQPGATAGCTTCGTNKFISSLGLPLILVGIAVIVLAFRK